MEFDNFFVGQNVIAGNMLTIVDIRSPPGPSRFEVFGQFPVNSVSQIGHIASAWECKGIFHVRFLSNAK